MDISNDTKFTQKSSEQRKMQKITFRNSRTGKASPWGQKSDDWLLKARVWGTESKSLRKNLE